MPCARASRAGDRCRSGVGSAGARQPSAAADQRAVRRHGEQSGRHPGATAGPAVHRAYCPRFAPTSRTQSVSRGGSPRTHGARSVPAGAAPPASRRRCCRRPGTLRRCSPGPAGEPHSPASALLAVPGQSVVCVGDQQRVPAVEQDLQHSVMGIFGPGYTRHHWLSWSGRPSHRRVPRARTGRRREDRERSAGAAGRRRGGCSRRCVARRARHGRRPKPARPCATRPPWAARRQRREATRSRS